MNCDKCLVFFGINRRVDFQCDSVCSGFGKCVADLVLFIVLDGTIFATWGPEMEGMIQKGIIKETSTTELRHQMRSGDLPAYLSLNYLSNSIVHFPEVPCLNLARKSHYSEIQRVCDKLTDGWTGTLSYTDARTHLKINNRRVRSSNKPLCCLTYPWHDLQTKSSMNSPLHPLPVGSPKSQS